MSLYQKYRAKKFGDVLMQNHVTEVLQSAIKNSSLGHAYLFVGTRGIGKTSIARIFARTLNCQDSKSLENAEPCNECQSCIESLSGSNIDIIEMDAASNRGIDEVRSLIDTVDFLPSSGKYKVYIIDEVHMMTKEAFNALLKTLEEPPAHIVFMMCTTELFKVPPTIVSRSQVFELKHATLDHIVAKINLILEAEGIDIDDEGKKLIAKLGRGSFRDTESILEKILVSSTNTKINEEDVINTLGLSSVLIIEKVKDLIYQRDLLNLQKFIAADLDEGNLPNFNGQLAESIYEDIVADLEKSTIDPFKTEVFDFLTSVNKDLRNTTHPKLLYIAKLLNFVKNHMKDGSAWSVVSGNKDSKAFEKTSSEISEAPQTRPEDFKGNPSAMLRASLKAKRVEKTEDTAQAEKSPKKENKFISKIDLLNFIKEKNLFLYRLFANNEFEINGDVLTVNIKAQMQKDLLMKPQNQGIFRDFGANHGINLRVEFGEVKGGSSETEKETTKSDQKKVEDLSEDEVKDIFKAKK